MNLRPNTIYFSCTTASPHRVLQMLLLSLLVTTLLATNEISTRPADDKYIELRCMCVNTISGIHPSKIQKLNVIRAGPHCDKVEVIATLKDGNEVCLDPEAPRIKKIVQKILEAPYSNLEDPEQMDRDLQCLCVENASQFHFRHISSLELIRASVYCPNIQVIATFKNGRKICLDPQIIQNKKIIRKLLKSQPLSA